MVMSDEVTNFTELLVEEALGDRDLSVDGETLQDLFCLVMNQLAPHYVRSTVDVRINMTPKQRQDKQFQIDAAISAAINTLNSARRAERRAS